MPKQVTISKKKLKAEVKKVAKELKEHFRQKDAWDINASPYADDALRPFFKTTISDYISYLILAELGPKVCLTLCKNKYTGSTFWGFSKRKK